MLPTRRTTRTTLATTTNPTTTVTEAQLQALIDQGVAAALAERDESRSRDGDNNYGTEGVVGLTQWAEKMESVFLISNCAITSQVKFASCTLQGSALTWWNSHVRAVGQDVAYTMPWTALKRMITDKYCPRGEIKKLESEYWNLKVRGKDKKRQKEAKISQNRQETEKASQRVKMGSQIKSRISPMQEEEVNEAQNEKPRTNVDKFQKLKDSFGYS
ncbi:reverse transcriptase domain-containing protein [Tanacetum coccineum]|uniref:Reverse transcriptase domain-containing protein n=1 Tax=Tanacetum coccineum TaxID=301880 RepID=A0ABQ5BCZ6_9ASTR